MKNSCFLRWICIVTAIILLVACGPLQGPSTEDVLKEYFKQALKHGDIIPTTEFENASVLIPEQHTLLNDRLTIQMPQNSQRMEDWQKEALQMLIPLPVTPIDHMIWANNSEVIVITMLELLATSSGNVEIDAQNYLTECNTLKQYEASALNAYHTTPIVMLKEVDYEKRPPYWGCKNIADAIVAGTDGNLMLIRMSVYTTKHENLPRFMKLAENIFASVQLGEHALDTQAREMLLGPQIAIALPDCYVGYDQGNYQVKTSYISRTNARKNRYNTPQIYRISKLERYKKFASHILFEFDRKMLVRAPSEFETTEYLSDSLLGNSIEWQYTKSKLYYEMQTVVPLGWGQTVRITIQSEDETTLQEMLDIAHTLEKK